MRIAIAYEIVTQESAEHGDAADRGWEDEDGIEFDSVDEVIEFLEDNGPMEPSYSHFDENMWYTGPVIQDRAFFELGQNRTLSYFLRDMIEEDKEAVFNTIVLGKTFSSKM